MRTKNFYRTQESTRPGVSQTKRYINERIFDIVSAFKNLRSIKYFYDPIYDSKELATNLIHALTSLPSFENLDIRFVDSMGCGTKIPRSISFQPLSNLLVFRISWGIAKSKAFYNEIASLLVRCPNLIELSLDQRYTRGLTLHQILQDIDKMKTEWKLEKLALKGVMVTPEDIKNHMRHFKHLSYLEILINDDPKASTTFGEICSILQENAIFLKGVSTDHPEDPLLIPYLSFYTGLTKLHLHIEDGQFKSPTTESEIINSIYTHIVPQHSATLEELRMGSREFRKWGEIPREEYLVELVRCRRLVVLDVHVKVCVEELREGWERGLGVYVERLKERSSSEIMRDRIRRVINL